ncbi:cytochrome P450 [Streptomyces sp. NPDC088732]|uniref:cytochrome P450 n=1 Tax=Streptomyces sp. NPDC088732 TaxID=3365879 RepID=UPI0037F506B7
MPTQTDATRAPQAVAPHGPEKQHQLFVPDDPLIWFDDARRTSPVLWHPETASWYITRFDDVWRLLLDDRLGARSPEPFLRELAEPQRAAARPFVEFLSRWPMFLDPPRHTVIRKVMRPAFTPDEVSRVAGIVQDSISPAHDGAAGADLVQTLFQPACRTALSALLGISAADFPRLVDWSERLMEFVGRGSIDLALVDEAEKALDELTDLTRRTLAAGGSPLAASVGRAVDAGVVGLADAVAIYAQIVTGALEPTVAVLAVAVEALGGGPAHVHGYRTDPDGFVTEAVRLATPFHLAPRRAARDLDVRGKRIPAGDRVVLVLVAANRDPERFPEPLSFRWDRTGAHVAFGRGRHACLGARVAHHTIRPVLDAYVSRFRLAPPPVAVRWSIGMGMRTPLGITTRITV